MYYIFDFDSTFVRTEGLEELAVLALAGRDDKNKILDNISAVTDRGMNGELDFTDSLSERLALMPINKKHVKELAELQRSQVSESLKRNKQFFLDNADSVYVFSGGFKDFITPVLLDFGLKEENIFANTFLYDKNDDVIGFDKNNFLSQANGKAKQLEKLKLNKQVCAIGDGWSDYEMKLSGLADYFVAFVENVRREKVMKKADVVINCLDELLLCDIKSKRLDLCL